MNIKEWIKNNAVRLGDNIYIFQGDNIARVEITDVITLIPIKGQVEIK